VPVLGASKCRILGIVALGVALAGSLQPERYERQNNEYDH
jgi:hypothetical protein